MRKAEASFGGLENLVSEARPPPPLRLVNVENLVLGTAEWHITTPLVGDYPIIHCPTHDTQHLGVKKEFWTKAW